MNIESISEQELQDLIQKAQASPRKRAIKIFHEDVYEGPQVGLNVIQPDSYIQPHARFTDESIIHYAGTLCSIKFDDEGILITKMYLTKKTPYLFLPRNTFHTIVSLEEDSALWMITQGPHKSPHAHFLPKTPSEKENYKKYFEYLKSLA